MLMASLSMKFICLALVLLLTSACLFTAHAHGVVEDDAVSSTEKEEEVFVTGSGIGGRKLMVDNKRVDTEGINAGVGVTGNPNWTANEELHAKETGNKRKWQKKPTHLPKTVKQEDGFVAFSADYHAPRHHPPKNN
ncbi:hypothetical protein JCGZ_11791 [Jatropha curcas]|uniref:Uncharacterized protein n=1 Tax=Jatropha curcas TaxID=180498 RepID=A0A067KGM1_JATCU|nr:root meristem growth factor 3 [Jatropha curcas]KDP31415.1 hypothetical protein JCGZ_11791 [Jatropha curcas]